MVEISLNFSRGKLVSRCYICNMECDDGIPVIAPLDPIFIGYGNRYAEQITYRHDECKLPAGARDMTQEEIADGRESVRKWMGAQ